MLLGTRPHLNGCRVCLSPGTAQDRMPRARCDQLCPRGNPRHLHAGAPTHLDSANPHCSCTAITMRNGLILGAAVALVLACTAQPARADADDLDATCSAIATSFLEDSAESNPLQFTADGCDGADGLLICDLRGSGGPCSANPACPDNQIEVIGCDGEDDSEAACCLEEFTQPTCEGCEEVLTACVSLCAGPAPPPRSIEERIDSICADALDLSLPRLAEEAPEDFAVGCDGAAAGQTCDLDGFGGPCAAVPECADVDINDGDCSADAAESGCCVVSLARPCDDCAPEPARCTQSCGSEMGSMNAADLTASSSEASRVSQAAGEGVCLVRGPNLLEVLAASNPDDFVVGCDDADQFVVCDLQTSVGACELNPVCPPDQIEPGSCSGESSAPLCCDVFFEKACEECEPIPTICRNSCLADDAAPPLSDNERLERFCVDEADIVTSQIRTDDPDALPANCTVAEPGEVCDALGMAGPCATVSECDELEISLGSTCTPANEDTSCCLLLVAPPCPGCTAEPVACLQRCGPAPSAAAPAPA